ncbi:MAG: FGGY-family carbohydrate kinase [Clostridia bacterium]|nr:FGGY-family carbohydrate kinase [Clostridia bacterium]
MEAKYVLAYDIGTTGVKTCLFRIDSVITLLESASMGYHLYTLPDGGAEQDADEWWDAMAQTTKKLFAGSSVKPEDIAGISFCSQMQGVVVVDRDGNALRRPMSYMDQRAKKEVKEGISNGIQVASANIFKLIPYLMITGAVSSSVKDPIWKYKWIENNEPEIFSKIYKVFDVKDYLICRCTGEFKCTQDSAFGFLLYDTRKGKEGWSKRICDMVGFHMEHLPEIVQSTDMIGRLTEKAAAELGLAAGTPVFGGGGDASLIGVGAGAVGVGETHIYSGTSGWVCTVVDKQMVDTGAMIAAIVGAQPGKFNYFAEMETASKCFEWVKEHLAEDEIDLYLDKHDITESRENYESTYTNLYEFLNRVVADVPAGSNGVIFTPWLHGNRCPFEDPNAAGIFFNIKDDTGKSDMIRAVLEGICFHLRWMYERELKKAASVGPVRFVGGGALSPVTSQMLADILGTEVETVASPQNVGSVGAAAVIGVGIGLINSLDDVKSFIPADRKYTPNPDHKATYDKNFEVFKKMYSTNKKLFAELNG